MSSSFAPLSRAGLHGCKRWVARCTGGLLCDAFCLIAVTVLRLAAQAAHFSWANEGAKHTLAELDTNAAELSSKLMRWLMIRLNEDRCTRVVTDCAV